MVAKSSATSDKKMTAAGKDNKQGYVVLARRYRPTQFSEVIGQSHVTRTLQNAIEADRVHHAYLFTGSRGVGKTTVARLLAKALNCEEGPTATPCGKCDICLEGNASVDTFEIDGASHTGVDDVRELRENVRYLPSRARRKIYIIDEVHMLSTSAFNALLKTLEEPPPHVVFMFATTEPHKIPATILSRCQRFDFKRVPAPQLVEHLENLLGQEKIAVDKAGLGLIARAAEGSVRDSLSLLDQVIAYGTHDAEISSKRVAEVLGVADRRVLFGLSQALLKKDASASLEIVARLFNDGQDLAQFSQAFLFHLRDLIVAKTCKEPAALLEVSAAELADLQSQSKDAELLQQYFDLFSRKAEEIARSSFPRLLLEMALVEMVHMQPLLPLGDLLRRLEEMEARVAARPGGGPSGNTGRRPPVATRAQPARAPVRTDERQAGPRAAPNRPQQNGAAPSRVAASAPPAGPAMKAAATPAPNQPAGQAPQKTTSTGTASAAKPDFVNDSGDLHTWQRLLKQAEQAHPVATSAFLTGRLLSWRDDAIELGYPPGSFDLERASNPNKRVKFEEECSRACGRKLQIVVRAMKPEELNSPEVVKMSAMEAAERKRKEVKEDLRSEAEGHPLTRAFVEDFGASIDSIETHDD